MVNSAAVATPGSARTTSSRHVSWDAIRVVAVLAVLVFHATVLAPVTLPGLDVPPAPLQLDFPFGASVLIVVSGYFAAMTIGKKGSPLTWWLRRLARLLPAFWAAVLFIFATTQLFAPEGLPRRTYSDLLGNLLLTQTLRDGVQPIDLAHWTVPIQVCGFTAMALLAWGGRVRGRTASVVLWTVLLVPLLTRYFFLGPGKTPPLFATVMLDGTGLNRAHLLIAGVAIFRWSKGRIGFAHLFCLLGVVLVAHMKHPPASDSTLAFAVALVLVCVAAYQPAWDLPALRVLARPIQWLAGISYGVYLMHYVVGTIVARRLADLGVPWWGWVPAFVGTAILLGWGLTRWVERPAFTLLTRPLDRKARLGALVEKTV